MQYVDELRFLCWRRLILTDSTLKGTNRANVILISLRPQLGRVMSVLNLMVNKLRGIKRVTMVKYSAIFLTYIPLPHLPPRPFPPPLPHFLSDDPFWNHEFCFFAVGFLSQLLGCGLLRGGKEMDFVWSTEKKMDKKKEQRK